MLFSSNVRTILMEFGAWVHFGQISDRFLIFDQSKFGGSRSKENISKLKFSQNRRPPIKIKFYSSVVSTNLHKTCWSLSLQKCRFCELSVHIKLNRPWDLLLLNSQNRLNRILVKYHQ